MQSSTTQEEDELVNDPQDLSSEKGDGNASDNGDDCDDDDDDNDGGKNDVDGNDGDGGAEVDDKIK